MKRKRKTPNHNKKIAKIEKKSMYNNQKKGKIRKQRIKHNAKQKNKTDGKAKRYTQ